MENRKQKHHKDVFDKIPEKKRTKLLEAAVTEFSSRGFEKARISDIARRAGVSHGSIYTYFKTKDDILKYIIQSIADIQSQGFSFAEDYDGDIIDSIRSILSKSFYIAETEPGIMAVWVSLSFEYNARFSKQIQELEAEGIRNWQILLEKARDRGEISAKVDLGAAAYLIDSLVANILKGYISEHEKMKLKKHFGDSFEKEEIIDRILTVLRPLLTG